MMAPEPKYWTILGQLLGSNNSLLKKNVRLRSQCKCSSLKDFLFIWKDLPGANE